MSSSQRRGLSFLLFKRKFQIIHSNRGNIMSFNPFPASPKGAFPRTQPTHTPPAMIPTKPSPPHVVRQLSTADGKHLARVRTKARVVVVLRCCSVSLDPIANPFSPRIYHEVRLSSSSCSPTPARVARRISMTGNAAPDDVTTGLMLAPNEESGTAALLLPLFVIIEQYDVSKNG